LVRRLHSRLQDECEGNAAQRPRQIRAGQWTWRQIEQALLLVGRMNQGLCLSRLATQNLVSSLVRRVGHAAYKISSEIGMPCRPGVLTGRLFQRAPGGYRAVKALWISGELVLSKFASQESVFVNINLTRSRHDRTERDGRT